MSRNLAKAVKTGIIVIMKITGIIIVIMVALLNMLPFAAWATNEYASLSENVIECHCDAMQDITGQSSVSENKAYIISCSSSDKQTQESQNHSRAIIISKCQVSNPLTSSYIYPETDYFAVRVYLSTETPPPRSLA